MSRHPSAPPSRWFAPEEQPALDDFWSVYLEYYDEIGRRTIPALLADPDLGPRVAQLQPEQLVVQRTLSLEGVRKGVEGDWSQYEDYLRQQAARYAEMGISFSWWYLGSRSMADALTPLLIRAFVASPARLEAALFAMRRFLGNAMALLAREYIAAQEGDLRNSAAQKQAILEAVLDGVVTFDYAGVISESNAAAEQLFGYEPGGLVGMPLAAILAPSRPDPEEDLAQALASLGGPLLGGRVEMSAVRASGELFPIELRIARVWGEGPPSFTCHVRDVTQLHRARAEQEAASRALAASREQLRALAARLERAREEERQRLERVIHEHLGQQLIALDLRPEDPGRLLARREPPAAAAARILLVDDHPLVRGGLRRLLEHELGGAVVGEAASAQQAMEQLGRSRWDAVILALALPGRGALEALKEIKAAQRDLPVLVMALHSEDSYALRAFRTGAAGYLAKDSEPDELVRALRKVLSGGRYVMPSLAEKLAESLTTGVDAPHEALSDRELQVLCLLASGKAVKEIGFELALSEKTISTYRTRILRKMKLRTTAELMRYALRARLVD